MGQKPRFGYPSQLLVCAEVFEKLDLKHKQTHRSKGVPLNDSRPMS